MAREITEDGESGEGSAVLNTMIRGIPGDVAVELDRRARENFRCRNSEMVAILTTVCRKKIKLPLVQLSELEVVGEESREDGAENGGDV